MAEEIVSELVLLQPENKPPFLGICFYRDFDASTSNINMIRYAWESKKAKVFPPALFHLQFELFARYCNIRILCSNPLDVYFYTGIKYNSGKLVGWLRKNVGAAHFNFGHMYKTNTDLEPRLATLSVNPPLSALIKIDRISIWVDFGVQFHADAASSGTHLNIVKSTT